MKKTLMHLKRKPIKPNLPSQEEIGSIFRSLEKKLKVQPELVKCSRHTKRERPGRPRKWKPGYQTRLSTRVRPETHSTLLAVARKRKLSIGEIIDEMVEPLVTA